MVTCLICFDFDYVWVVLVIVYLLCCFVWMLFFRFVLLLSFVYFVALLC